MDTKIVRIKLKEKTGKGAFVAELAFPSENVYEVQIRDPFLDPGEIEINQEKRLRWYFEERLESPFTDTQRAKRAVESIASYGESLFSQVFHDPKALMEWQSLVNGLGPLRFQVWFEDPEFQSLHWEALKSPDEDKPWCLKDVEIVRTTGAGTIPMAVLPSDTLNLLMVTARPHGKDDVEYRTITRPVVESIEKNRLKVQVHLLRPPTWTELKERLSEHKGFYHIVHLDLHGAVIPFEVYEGITKECPGKRTGGRRPIERYEGTRAFLFLTGEEGGADPVLAEEMASMFRDAHIPICFLNACQSGMSTQIVIKGQDGGRAESPDSSLANIFLKHGMSLVLGSAWSITVTAARIMMKELYERLTRGEEPGKSIRLARQALFHDRERGIGFELEDWLLPVAWKKGEFSLDLRKPDFEREQELLEREERAARELKGVKTSGAYGFLGRDVDILNIETMLHRKNILLVRGMGGTGKTTLLGHIAEWWQKTGWIDHTFYFGYDQNPWGAEAILNSIAEAVLPKEKFGKFLVLPSVSQKSLFLSGELKQGKGVPSVLLILDNIESITGTEKAVGHTLDKTKREELRSMLKVLGRSSIKILLGSRSQESWLAEDTFQDNVYILEGLDRKSRFALSQLILKRKKVEDWTEFHRLMDILAGYPLAMEIILPNLDRHTPADLRKALTGAGVDLKGGEISEEIFKCANISFSLLSDKARESLLVFAPFTSFLMADSQRLKMYFEELRKTGQFPGLELKDLEEAISQAEGQGLLKESSAFPKAYSIQPVLPFFLNQRARELWDKGKRKGLEEGFTKHLATLVSSYTGLMKSKKAGERQAGINLFKLERENLHNALHSILEARGDFYSLYDIFAAFYHLHPQPNEAVEFLDWVAGYQQHYPQDDKEVMARFGAVIVNSGYQHKNLKNYEKARESLKTGIDLLHSAGKRKESAVGYHQLGMVAQEERDFEEARKNYQEALKIKQEFNDRYVQADTYHQLGWLAQEERDFEEARKNYREALKIKQEFNDRYAQAATYHQLGMVAQEERDFDEARNNYREALKIYQEFNDRYTQAGAYHQLGRVAEEERDFDEARKNYREALKIYQEFNDRYAQAATYHQLGCVAQREQDFDEARKNYREALKIQQEFNDRYSQAGAYHQLGMVAQEEKDYPLALRNYAQALEIFDQFGDKHNVEKTIENLNLLNEKFPLLTVLEKQSFLTDLWVKISSKEGNL